MRVLLVGDGAREHMLAEQLARSSELYVAMEQHNPGIESVSNKAYVSDVANIEALGSWAIKEKIDMALVTSERALAKGVSDALADAGVRVTSPPSTGSVMGENRVYSYNLMKAAGIARPGFSVCKTAAEIKRAVKEFEKVVMKPAVRVEWKGTKFADMDFKRKTDLERQGKRLIKRHGSVVLDEMLDGESFTLQAFTDGKAISVMPPVHTVKRALEGGKGELTEGMGGFSTGKLLPFMEQTDLDHAKLSLRKLIAMLKKKGVDYRGPIRGEFMTTGEGTMMLDAYATFGGIATMNNFIVLKTQLVEVLSSIADHSLKPVSFIENATAVKYLVPIGYPEKSGGRKSEVTVDERVLWNNGAKAYVHSLKVRNGKIYPTNDRTLAICAKADTIEEANAKVEGAIKGVEGNLEHRSDIAHKKYINNIVKHLERLRRKQ